MIASTPSVDRSPTNGFAVIALLSVLSVLSTGSLLGQCGFNSPAFPIPETCRAGDTCTGPLWPPGFGPALPGLQIPADRDSTDYISQSLPTRAFGHELFESVDIEDNNLFVAYGNGIQVWSLSNPASPSRLALRDGGDGHFLHYGALGENGAYITDLDAIDPTTGSAGYLVAASGEDPVGVTLWSYVSGSSIPALYQDPDIEVWQIRLEELGGRVYAFAAADTDGVRVYDVTTARSLSNCLDNPTHTACPGVYRGQVGGAGTSFRNLFMDTIVRDGAIYVAVADGDNLGMNKVELWRLDNPSNPGSAQLSWDGGDANTHGLALYSHNGTYYLAAVEDESDGGGTLKIFNATNCLDADGCTTLPLSGSLVFPGTHPTLQHSLTYSQSGSTPYLFHGIKTVNAAGPRIEHLLNVSNPSNITNITTGGGTYTEGCNSRTGIDYWGDYYERNENGLRNVQGRRGKFDGNYFYRAAFGILDVHVSGSASPQMTTTVTSSAPHYFDEGVSFSATAQNCPGTENWTWSASDMSGSGLGMAGATTTVTWPNDCGLFTCPNEFIDVEAVKDVCAGQSPQINGVTVVLTEPRARVQSLDVSPNVVGLEYPLCTELTFTAAVNGKAPITRLFEVRDSMGALVTSNTGTSLIWDTSTVQLGNDIFADGFESGDTTAWGAPQAPLVFDVSVLATNSHDLVGDLAQIQVTLSTEQAQFEDPALSIEDLGAGEFRVTANATNATEYRFEFEDPGTGSAVGCEHYALCVIRDWSDDPQATHHWIPPNPMGLYDVTVEIRGCNTVTPPLAEATLDVTPEDPDPPLVTLFEVNEAVSVPNPCDCTLGFCTCTVNGTVTFSAAADGDPDRFEVDWDDGSPLESFSIGQTISHTFTTTGNRSCQVTAYRGTDASPPEEVDQSLLIIP